MHIKIYIKLYTALLLNPLFRKTKLNGYKLLRACKQDKFTNTSLENTLFYV